MPSTATATFGSRYLFSELDQTGLDLTVRMDLSLTPNLSVQLWAQPFVATADYDGFKELVAPGTFSFLRYGEEGASTLTFDEEGNSYQLRKLLSSAQYEVLKNYPSEIELKDVIERYTNQIEISSFTNYWFLKYYLIEQENKR